MTADDSTGGGPQVSSPGISARVFANLVAFVFGTAVLSFSFILPTYIALETGLASRPLWSTEQAVLFSAVFVGIVLLLTAGEEVNHAE